MADNDDMSEAIRTAAQGPESVSADGLSVKRQPISEIIKAEQHLANKKAAASRTLGLRFLRVSPPGAT